MNDTLHFCFVTDDGYVIPTVVAIRSLIENGLGGRHGVVHVIAADLADANVEACRRCATADVEVKVVRASAADLATLHKSEGGMCVATPAALLKFSLGELLPDLDRVLYLDGDILVKRSLAPIFATSLGDAVLAAAPDTGVLYCRRPIHDEVRRYFNSGVMLLDLKRMREDGYAEKLIAAKRAATDHTLMDQDVFNRVFDGRWRELSPRCNFLLLNLLRAQAHGLWTMTDFNAAFKTAYADLGALDGDALIVHFSSKDKPWKFSDVPYAARWTEVFGRTPFGTTELNRALMDEDWPVRLPLASAANGAWWGRGNVPTVRKIALVYHSLGKGGVERVASAQIPMFVRMGLEVVVFTDMPEDAGDYRIACAFKRICLTASEDDPIAHGAQLRQKLLEEGVDLLFHHDAYVPARFAADVRAARTAGIPVALFWHNVFSHFLLRPGRQMETQALFEACRGVSVVFTHTHTDEAFFRLYGLSALRNPIGVPDLMSGCVRERHSHRILWMGRLVEQKRPLHALEVYSRVHERFADAELVMLGSGDAAAESEIRRWLRAHPECARGVRLEGFRKDVRPYLESCGVGLVTSRFEGFCCSLVEMKMASMPVVAYEMPYLDTLKPGSGAICVPQGDVEAAANEIIRLFGDEAEMRRQGECARRSYEEIAAVSEEATYREFFAHLEGRRDLDLETVDVACARTAVATLVAHVQQALELMAAETAAGWSRDRSYRLGRLLTWPYRKCKELVRILV